MDTEKGPVCERGSPTVVHSVGSVSPCQNLPWTVTVAELPVGGTFTVTEDHAWSCRYMPAEPREVTIPEDGADIAFHNTPDGRKEGCFFGETSVRNLFQGGKSG